MGVNEINAEVNLAFVQLSSEEQKYSKSLHATETGDKRQPDRPGHALRLNALCLAYSKQSIPDGVDFTELPLLELNRVSQWPITTNVNSQMNQ